MVLKSMAEGYGGIVSNVRPAIFKVTSQLLDKPDDDSEMEFVSVPTISCPQIAATLEVWAAVATLLE